MRDQLSPELAGKKNVYYRDVPAPLRDRLWEMFESALRPLKDARKLGVIVLQFPPWFMPRRSSFRHLEECNDHLSGFRVALEFRSRYWLKDDNLETTLGFLRQHGLCYVAVDEPQGFESSVSPVADVTGEIGMVRFHGRNRDTWEAKGLSSSAQRFDYYYTPQELEEWVPKVKMMQENASQVHLVVNTNNGDQGIVNARMIGELMGGSMRV